VNPDVLVAGGGVFGVAAAIELAERGARVTIVDPGPLPHPDASSTDISKLVRADYGADALYAGFMLDGFAKWRAWNDELGTFFHETGVLVLAREPMQPGGFEYESHALLAALHASGAHPKLALERLAGGRVSERFPEWAPGTYQDGYFNPLAGWVESGRVVAALVEKAKRLGVRIRERVRLRPLEASRTAIDALETTDGERLFAAHYVVAAGAHTPVLLPELADRIRPIAQCILHFEPSDPGAFTPPKFVPWAADIARTGWYGFAAIDVGERTVVKVACHAKGERRDPSAPREVPTSIEPAFRSFLRESLPALAGAPIAARRVCFYSDSFDGDFFIDRHPRWPNVTVASGGSGHAFKFGPLLGAWIADAVTAASSVIERFRWRELAKERREAARASA
jgi:glycine/D-amino acid oxidase-like deaminating enzyme